MNKAVPILGGAVAVVPCSDPVSLGQAFCFLDFFDFFPPNGRMRIGRYIHQQDSPAGFPKLSYLATMRVSYNYLV